MFVCACVCMCLHANETYRASVDKNLDKKEEENDDKKNNNL